MLDIGPEKLLVLLVIALAVLGPEGIPRVAKGIGKARAEIRRIASDVPPDAMHALTNPRGALLDAVSGPRHAIAEAVDEPRLALADALADFTLRGPSTPGDHEAGAGGASASPDDPGLN